MIFFLFYLFILYSAETSGENQRKADNYRSVVMDRVKNNIADKWKDASPYYFFLSAISDSKETHIERLSIHFPGEIIYIFFKFFIINFI